MKMDLHNNRCCLYLLPFAIAAAVLLFIATKEGIGLTPDSSSYIGAARSILAGKGISVPFSDYSDPREIVPLIGFPPLYPFILAGFGLLGLDPLIAARVAAVVLFFINVFLIGAIVYRHTQSFLVSAMGSLLALLSVDMLDAHYKALSEPLFVCLLLLSSGSLYEYLANGRAVRGYLIVCSVCIGLLLVTRYAGLLLLPVLMIPLVVLGKKSLRHKLEDLTIFSVLALLPFLIWTTRNKLIIGSATGRGIMFAPIMEDVQLGFQTISQWFIPDDIDSEGISGGLIILLLSLFWLILMVRAFQRQTKESGYRQKAFLLIFWPLVFSYLVMAFITDSFITKIRLDSRVLLPAYVLSLVFIPVVVYQLRYALIGSRNAFTYVSNKSAKYIGALGLGMGIIIFIIGFTSGQEGMEHLGIRPRQAGLTFISLVVAIISTSIVWRKRNLFNIAGLIIVAGTITVYAYRAIIFTHKLSNSGIAYSAKTWRDSKLIAALRTEPLLGRTIYSNGYDAIYLYNGKPTKSVYADRLKNEQDWMELSDAIKRTNGLFVYFKNIPIGSRQLHLPSESALLEKFSLHLVLETLEGRIYEATQ